MFVVAMIVDNQIVLRYSTKVMQYSVISTGGKQYLAVPGQKLVIESVAGDAGQAFAFEQVLLQVDGDQVSLGAPFLDGVKVLGTIVEQSLADKIRVFKYREKSRYRRTTGHRQHQTIVLIDKNDRVEKPVASTKEDAPVAKVSKAKKATAVKE
jgi:large subunit ribosomal protein L21